MKTLSIDFDGVIHSYEKGWQNGEIYGHVLPGFFDFVITNLNNYKFCIFSTRSSDPVLKQKMIDWLESEFQKYLDSSGYFVDYQIFHYPSEKPKAFASIDDRAVRFCGYWNNDLVPQQTWIEEQHVYKQLLKFIDTAINSVPCDRDGDSCDSDFVKSHVSSHKVNLGIRLRGFMHDHYSKCKSGNYSFLTREHIFRHLLFEEVIVICFSIFKDSEVFDDKKYNIIFDILSSPYLHDLFSKDTIRNTALRNDLSKFYLTFG